MKTKLDAIRVGELVYLEWEDSFGCGDKWESIPADLKPTVMICKSVGWVIAKNDRAMVVVPHLGHYDQHGVGDMTVPIAAIIKAKRLNGPSRKVTSS